MTLFIDNFNGPFDPSNPNSNYMFFSVPGVVTANDGTTSVSGSGLTINSSPFTYSNNTSLDHVKYLVFRKAPFKTQVGLNKEILFEADMSVKQTGLDTIPQQLKAAPGTINGIVDSKIDPRPCCGAFNVVDFNTLLVFDFIITNKMVYALVERLPFNLPEWGGSQTYNAYTHLIPVHAREICENDDPLDDILKLGISYDYTRGVVKWLIKNKEVFRINNPGKFLDAKYRVTQITPIGQPAYPQHVVRSPDLWVGFGTFSLLEASYPINPLNQVNVGLVNFTMGGYFPYADANAAPPDANSIALNYLADLPQLNNTTVFGQGADLRIKKLKVSTRNVDNKIKIVLTNGLDD